MKKKLTKQIMRCPECKHAAIISNKDGTSFCRYCGYVGKRKEFQEPWEIKL